MTRRGGCRLFWTLPAVLVLAGCGSSEPVEVSVHVFDPPAKSQEHVAGEGSPMVEDETPAGGSNDDSNDTRDPAGVDVASNDDDGDAEDSRNGADGVVAPRAGDRPAGIADAGTVTDPKLRVADETVLGRWREVERQLALDFEEPDGEKTVYIHSPAGTVQTPFAFNTDENFVFFNTPDQGGGIPTFGWLAAPDRMQLTQGGRVVGTFQRVEKGKTEGF